MSASPVLGIRVSEQDRAAIDARAAEYRMTRTDYMVRAALDELPGTASLEARVEDAERRLADAMAASGYCKVPGNEAQIRAVEAGWKR